jgi:class 3 adenylate cyclase/tetratricopeptide (TPR) repeat protein
MQCARCNAENPAGMRFCGQCAAPLPVLCPSCGAANPVESRFCSGCATPLPAPGAWSPTGGALPGEIKQVTVLFCDIVNSMMLTESLGAEAMRDLVGAFIDTSLAEIHRYGGTAPQFSGDGFMALFGAPIAHEDHVRRALLAALAIHLALAGESSRGSTARPDVQIRIGVHTGPVVFGAIGVSFRLDTAIGDTANLAARLQQAAEPGTILVSEAVPALARAYARFAPVGPLQLKGKAEPVPAFRLIGVSPSQVGRDAVSPPRLTGFVGREREVSLLEHYLEQVENGRGQIVAVAGEPGIGKSRLLAEFRRRIADGHATWVEGHCVSYGAAIPYQLVLDALRSHCGIAETDGAETIARKVRSGLSEAGLDAGEDSPVLLHLLGVKEGSGAAAAANPETAKARSFDVCARLCLEGSRRRPLVLVLEDLHWTDTISEEFFGHLATRLAEARVLLLGTYRPEYRPPWAGLENSSEIALPSLSRDDSLFVVRSVLADAPLAEPLAEEIVAKADGNPLFLEQLALHAGEVEKHSDIAVPHTIHGVVTARIDRLPEATKQLLQVASVIGREFSLRLLRAVWGERGPLEAALRELSRLEFLDEWPDDEGTTYVFRHALTQEAAYRSLLANHRRFHHRAVGEALEELYPGRAEEVAELLAWHFGRSDEAEKAVDYAIIAAVKAGRGWANSEALTYFDDALRRLDTIPDTGANRLRRIDAVLRQAEVKYALGRYRDQLEALQEICGLVAEVGDAARRAAWQYWTGFLHSTSGGRPEVAIQHCREAANIASAAGLDEVSAFAQSCLAQVYMVAGRQPEAIEAGERALASFEASGNPWWAALTLWHLSSAANYLGQWEASLTYCRRSLRHGFAADDARLKVVSWTRLGLAYIQQGDLEEGLRCCNEALSLGPIPRDAAWARVVRGYGKIKARHLDDGVEELGKSLAWFESSHMRWTHVIGSVWLAEGYLRCGDYARARPLIEDVLMTSRSTGYLHYEGRGCWLMSECLAAEDPATAEDYAETAIRIFENLGAQNDLARTLITRAALFRAAGDGRAARRLLDRAYTTFVALGTWDEILRVKSLLAEFDSGTANLLLVGASCGVSCGGYRR